MLSKLLKYELQATARFFVPLYGLLILFALINKAFIAINSDKLKIPTIISITVFAFIIIGISVMTLVVTIQRFYKNLLSDEGYLMFTLPVKTHTQITTKLLISMMWCILSVLVTIFSVFLTAANKENMADLSLHMSKFWEDFSTLGSNGTVFIIELILFVIITLATSIISIYAAVMVGNLCPKHRIITSLGAYIGFGVIQQIVFSIILVCVPHNWYDNFSSAVHFTQIQSAQFFILCFIVFDLFFGVAFYIFTNLLLKKKLNLE